MVCKCQWEELDCSIMRGGYRCVDFACVVVRVDMMGGCEDGFEGGRK